MSTNWNTNLSRIRLCVVRQVDYLINYDLRDQAGKQNCVIIYSNLRKNNFLIQ